MVTRKYMHIQGGDGPEALQGWGHPDLPSFTAGDMRALLCRSDSRFSTRMVYAILLIHADAAGFAIAPIAAVAEAAHLTYRGARNALDELVKAGEVVRVRRGGPLQTAIWRIKRVAELAA